EVDRASDRSRQPGAQEEAELPVVDVEHERTAALPAREQPDAEARRARLRRVEDVAVGEARERAQPSREARIPRAFDFTPLELRLARRAPEVRAEARPDDVHA